MKARERVIQHIPKGAIGVEIGVHLGDYSQRILDISKPKLLYLVDPWTVFHNDEHADSWYGVNNVNQKIMDERYELVLNRFADNDAVKVIRAKSTDAADTFEDSSLDYIYLDGYHSYEGVCADFDAYFPKLKRKGFIYGDDYIANNWWGAGVIDAVHKNLHEKDLQVVFITESQFCIQKL